MLSNVRVPSSQVIQSLRFLFTDHAGLYQLNRLVNQYRY